MINVSDDERDERDNTVPQKTSSLNEEQEPENLSRIDPENTKHTKMLLQIFSIFSFLGKPIGVKFQYDYCFWNEPGFYFAVFVKLVTWTGIMKTIYILCKNGDYERILEPLAITGGAISVRRIFITISIKIT